MSHKISIRAFIFWIYSLMDLAILDASYDEYLANLSVLSKDKIIEINSQLLESFDISINNIDLNTVNPFTSDFNTVELNGKLTVYNDKCVIWITSLISDQNKTSYIFIGLINNSKIILKTVFTAKNEFNRTPIILAVLDNYLPQIL